MNLMKQTNQPNKVIKMAYINQEEKKLIANAIKAAFPNDRFSFSVKHHSSLYVKVRKSELLEQYHGKELDVVHWGEHSKVKMDMSNFRINEYWFKEHLEQYPELVEYFDKLINIILEVGGHYDNSDLMADYHNVAFYYHVEVELKGLEELI